MLNPDKLLLRVNKAWLADSTRVVKDRLPGAFASIVNLIPNLSDGIGQVRTGFEEYTTALGGHNAPANTKILKSLPISTPTESDIHLYFIDNAGTQSVNMWPYFRNGAEIDEEVNVVQTLRITTGFTLTAMAQNEIYFDDAGGSDQHNLAGLSDTNDYYNGWMVYNVTQGEYALIKDFAYNTPSAGQSKMTFVEDVNNNSPSNPNLGWVGTDTLLLVKNFHDNPYHSTDFAAGFTPKFNDSKQNPPCVNVENSIIRVSGGQGSTHFNLRGWIIFPNLNSQFFQSVSGRNITYNRTYCSERELKTLVVGNILQGSNEIATSNGGGNTETLVPIADAGGEHWRTVPSSQPIYSVIDDGATPNDSEYTYPLYWNRLCWNKMRVTQITAGLVNGANLTLYYRYRNHHTSGSNVLYIQLRDGNTDTILNSVTLDADTGANWVNGSFTVLQTADLDTSNLIVFIQTDGGTAANDVRISNIYLVANTLVDETPLTANKTYWVGVAAIYDGYQIGPLLRLEDTAYYVNASGQWTGNWCEAYQGLLGLNFAISLAKLNKRITGFAIYCAVDDGYQAERVNKYFFVKQVSLITDDDYASSWTYHGASGTFRQTININQADIDAAPTTYETDTGIPETMSSLETMHSYSIEEIVAGRRCMANIYGYIGVDAALETNNTHLFTNPEGGNAEINAGTIQPDLFPAEEAIYQLRIEPILGTRINGIVPTGIDEILILKDRGVVQGRIIVVQGIPDVAQTIISESAGLTTTNEWAKDEDGNIIFPGYDDIYAWKNNVLSPLIEREDKNDWLDTYRGMTTAQRELATVFTLAETKSTWVLFNNVNGATFTGKQFMFYRGIWSQLSLLETSSNGVPTIGFRWHTKLRNGHTIVTSTETTPKTYRMSFKWGAGPVYSFVYDDDNTAIVPYIDTGLNYMGGESLDTYLDKAVINTTLDSANDLTGSLSVSLINDTLGGHIGSGLSLTDRRLSVYIPPQTVRMGAAWKVIYNGAASGRVRLQNGVDRFQFNSIEFFGDTYDRVRSSGK